MKLTLDQVITTARARFEEIQACKLPTGKKAGCYYREPCVIGTALDPISAQRFDSNETDSDLKTLVEEGYIEIDQPDLSILIELQAIHDQLVMRDFSNKERRSYMQQALTHAAARRLSSLQLLFQRISEKRDVLGSHKMTP